YGRDCVALHFTWRKDWDGVRALLPLMEAQLAPYEPAPHWGKLFTMPARDVQARYAKLGQFQQLLRAFDPAGKFRNAFLDTYIYGTACQIRDVRRWRVRSRQADKRKRPQSGATSCRIDEMGRVIYCPFNAASYSLRIWSPPRLRQSLMKVSIAESGSRP